MRFLAEGDMGEKSLTFQKNSEGAELGRSVYLKVRDEESKRPMELQEELLMQLLQDNKDTEYGRKYDFASIKSIDEYRSRVPVTVYDDLAPFIERM